APNKKLSNTARRCATSAGGFFLPGANARPNPVITETRMTDSTAETINPQINFAKMDGLLPAIIQDDATGQVLMLGFMNEASWQHTRQTGYLTFWRRTRQKLWTKGETSGNRLRIIDVTTDCDQDT